jgi:hypothetical protein
MPLLFGHWLNNKFSLQYFKSLFLQYPLCKFGKNIHDRRLPDRGRDGAPDMEVGLPPEAEPAGKPGI